MKPYITQPMNEMLETIGAVFLSACVVGLVAVYCVTTPAQNSAEFDVATVATESIEGD